MPQDDLDPMDIEPYGFSEQLEHIEAERQAQDERRLQHFREVRGPGRPPGSRNKVRPGFREMTYEVLNSIEMGGLQGYIQWALAHKTDFYSRLCPKLFGGEFTLALAKPFGEGQVTFVMNVPHKQIDNELAESGPVVVVWLHGRD